MSGEELFAAGRVSDENSSGSARTRFFDRPAPEGYAAELAAALRAPLAEGDRDAATMLLFRIGAFRLALPCAGIVAITPICPVCSIPHRRNTAFLGLTAFSGEILPACSLARILGVADRADGPDARTLVIADAAGKRERWGVPVDAVLRVSSGRLQPHPESGAGADQSLVGATWSRQMLLDGEGERTEVLHMPTLLHRLRRALS